MRVGGQEVGGEVAELEDTGENEEECEGEKEDEVETV